MVNIDLHMKELVRVDDLYKDKTTFVKSLVKGLGTASPYNDCYVWSILLFSIINVVIYSEGEDSCGWNREVLQS